MKYGLKLLSLSMVAALSLAACGTTAASTDNTDETAGAGSTTNEGTDEVVEDDLTVEEYAPQDVLKPEGGEMKIGVSFAVLDQFLQTVADQMETRAEEAGVDLTIVSAQEKLEQQLSQVENFISQDVDAIIVVPQDTDATGPMTDKAQEAGIPLVYVNRKPASLPKGVPYVGSDSLLAGQLEMEALAELSGHKGNVAILMGPASQEAPRLRTQGCKDVVEKYPDMEVIREQAGDWQRDKGLAITENWIQSGDQIDIICSNNDDMALGAIQAYKDAGKLDSVLIGGVDATADALQAMEAGELDVTVFQDAAGQGQAGVDAAIALHNGETTADVINVPYKVVQPNNLAEFK